MPGAVSSGSEQVRGYRPELDAVRFLAFFLVFLHHASPTFEIGERGVFSWAGPQGWRIGFSLVESFAIGLCLFFALSAYLITDLLLRERDLTGRVSIRKFYIRRILRIWPLYFFGVAIGAALALLFHRTHDLHAFVFFLLFTGNLYCMASGWLRNPMDPLWSISIEEQFYLIWPWTIRWFGRRGLIAGAILFIAIANGTLFWMGQHHVETELKIWPNTLVQFEMFAVGALLALAKNKLTRINAPIGLLLVFTGPALWFVACLAFNAKQPAEAGRAISGFTLVLAYALIAIGCASILQGFCMFGGRRIPAWLAHLGRMSYGLYVYHYLFLQIAKPVFGSVTGKIGVLATDAVALVLTVAAAAISYEYLEAPFLRLKRRFELLHSRPI